MSIFHSLHQPFSRLSRNVHSEQLFSHVSVFLGTHNAMYSPNSVLIIPNNTLRVERDLCSIFPLCRRWRFLWCSLHGRSLFLKSSLISLRIRNCILLQCLLNENKLWNIQPNIKHPAEYEHPCKISNLSLSANLKTVSLFKIWGGLIRYISLCSPLIKKGEHPKVISLFHLKKILKMTFSKLLHVQFQF